MDRSELELTAELALVRLDDQRLAAFEASVGELLDHFALMSNYDVSGLEPTTHALQEGNRLRHDVHDADDALPDLILEQVPDLEDRYISIPNVL
jgi:aspartyl-tRNA(Asn)/glutamyl-tRNA(Gln) amidotransferase subunit C